MCNIARRKLHVFYLSHSDSGAELRVGHRDKRIDPSNRICFNCTRYVAFSGMESKDSVSVLKQTPRCQFDNPVLKKDRGEEFVTQRHQQCKRP